MARKPRPYFILAMMDGTPTDTPWAMHFGDYDREPVEFEMQEFRDKGWKKSELKLIKLPTDTQAAIDAAIAKLNVASMPA